MTEVYAQGTPLFGTIAPPITNYPTDISGITVFFTNILRLAFVVAGIWAFINFILAGYSFLTASGDPKKLAAAWQKIYFSIIGLAVLAASFILAGVIGYVIFGDVLFILRPKIYTP